MFSDLECDYINPIDLCNKLNQFVLPEMGAQAFLFAMFLINGSWLAALLNLPLVAFNVQKVTNNRHMYDATEIFRTLSVHKKECFIKLAFYLLILIKFYDTIYIVSQCEETFVDTKHEWHGKTGSFSNHDGASIVVAGGDEHRFSLCLA
ncbi:hypothetical protein NQZ79_g2395 [Umbelopsis isabellina]|nr:hypothetical protein NQZ79_g2395 [Umbelopsis isabellina]